MVGKSTEVEVKLRESDPEAIPELRCGEEVFEREMEISRRMKASILEEVHLGMSDDPHPVSAAKELKSADKATMIALLTDYRDAFVWLHEDMTGLDPKFYQHQIHLNKDEKLVHQRRYQMCHG